MLADFSKRLKKLMDNEKISRRMLALKTGSQRKSVLNWLNGIYYPRYDSLIRLADYFNVSCDYLLGEVNDASIKLDPNVCPIEEVPELFIRRLNQYIVKNKITMYQLAKKLRMEQSTLSKWINSKSMPEISTLIKLAIVMEESVDYLLGRC